jgi:hypothetical protein
MKLILLPLILTLGAAQLSFAQTKTTAPSFSGVWLRPGGAGGGAGSAERSPQLRLPVSQWSTEQLPFTPTGLAKLNANKSGKGPRAVIPALGNDPLGQANPPGLYRTLIYNRAFEMVHTDTKIIQMFEWARAWRIIWMDGRAVPDEVDAGPFWYGHSVGKWEGDTLVVQTLGLDARAWLDEWGTPFTDAARIEERWRRTAANKLELTIKVTDPATYTKPWTSIPIVYTMDKDLELTEQIFAPIDEVEFNKRIRDPAAGLKK